MPEIEPVCHDCNTVLVDQECAVCKTSKKDSSPVRRGCDEFDDGMDGFPKGNGRSLWGGYWPPGDLSPLLGHPSMNERY